VPAAVARVVLPAGGPAGRRLAPPAAAGLFIALARLDTACCTAGRASRSFFGSVSLCSVLFWGRARGARFPRLGCAASPVVCLRSGCPYTNRSLLAPAPSPRVHYTYSHVACRESYRGATVWTRQRDLIGGYMGSSSARAGPARSGCRSSCEKVSSGCWWRGVGEGVPAGPGAGLVL
jgi:hypothetical protein